MAPFKIEDNIREKMQERELQPSEGAWAKLEARLGEEKNSGLNRNTWYAIAAGFIGILILASVFFNSNSLTNEGEIVQEDTYVEELNSGNDNEFKELISEPDTSEDELAIDEKVLEEKDNAKTVPVLQKIIAKKEPKEQNEIKIDQKIIAASEVEEQPEQVNETRLIEDQPTDNRGFVESKVNEVVAEVENRIKTNSTVTPEEVDALLMEAQREISNQRILNSQTKKVDAAALLEDVEFEMERSFRDKVFDALGDGYNKIKTAVAERNN
ncbi:MAG: hypothetical protein KJO39_03975 [Bacteroidia bacterium]|nr:hypothetical protein [Bacteroidia bacterium]